MSGRRWRRRNPVPALVVFVVLIVVAARVWLKVFHRANDLSAPVSCPQPLGTDAGTAVGYSSLDGITPAPPGSVRVRVLNATGRPGLAARVTQELGTWGLGQAAPPSDDTAYSPGNLSCVGEIRYGPRGARAARTLSLLAPCTQLRRDGRTGAAVDLVLGEKSARLAPTSTGRVALDQLAAWHRARPGITGGSVVDDAQAPPTSPRLRAAAHDHRTGETPWQQGKPAATMARRAAVPELFSTLL